MNRHLNSLRGFALWLVLAPAGLCADEFDFEPEPVHWAFSAFLGTGWYKIDEARTIFVLRMSPRQVVRESAFSIDGKRTIGVDILYPVSIGYHNVDELPGFIDPDNFSTTSFTPGVELEIPVTERWYLRPYVNLGYGAEFGTESRAWIYRAGLKSRYQLDTRGDWTWGLIAGLEYAGFKPNSGQSNGLTTATLGVELNQPLTGSAEWKNAYDLNWQLTYNKVNPDVAFATVNEGSRKIDGFIELGLALSPRGRAFDFWLYKPLQLGFSIQLSDDGDYAGIKFNSRSWFFR